MNTTLEEAVSLVKAVVAQGAPADVQVVFFPPFPYIRAIRELLVEEMSFSVGGQDCSAREKGAFTGDVASYMLRDVGCRYVIVGHSERREQHNETGELLGEKIRQALANHLSVIYCCGEKLAERKTATHFDTVTRQLLDIRDAVTPEQMDKFVIAYEPVWAIGTGETATSGQAQEMHAHIRRQVSLMWGEQAGALMPVLYGGSCNAGNAKQLFAGKDVDGGLIGGASLKAAEFASIIRSF